MPAKLAKRLQLQPTPSGSREVRVAAASKAREEAVAAAAKADALERSLGSPRGSQLDAGPPLPRARSESARRAMTERVQARQAEREDLRQAEQARYLVITSSAIGRSARTCARRARPRLHLLWPCSL